MHRSTEFPLSSEEPNSTCQTSNFSVATWNVNSIAALERQVLDWLEVHQPTVLALQETQCGPSRFPKTGFHKLGYEIVSVGDGGTNGVANASSQQITNIELGMPGAHTPFDEPRFIATTVDGVRIVCAYAPNGRKSLAARVTSITSDRATRAAPNTSDHAPILAHFNLEMEASGTEPSKDSFTGSPPAKNREQPSQSTTENQPIQEQSQAAITPITEAVQGCRELRSVKPHGVPACGVCV